MYSEILAALTLAEQQTGRCLPSEQFCLVVPEGTRGLDTLRRDSSYAVITVRGGPDYITLVERPSERKTPASDEAIKIFNGEMKNATN
jgi:hypothetical protein